MDTLEDVRSVLRDVLQLGSRADELQAATPLFGSIPELDSMAVAAVMVALEERFDFVIEEDEVSAETFETVGTLSQFVAEKLAA